MMFQIFKKRRQEPELPPIDCDDEDILAMADGKMISLSQVSDPVFSKKLMGESCAFHYDGHKTVLCAPANGRLEVLFPTGHAFGIRMNNGVGLLVHIGVNTVEAGGNGFRLLGRRQGEEVRAGDPIVEVFFEELSQTYDMSTMLIITEPNGKEIHFQQLEEVRRGQKLVL